MDSALTTIGLPIALGIIMFGLGLSQVLVTVAGTLLGHALLVLTYHWVFAGQWQMSWQGAIVLGSAMAMSWTA